MSISDLSGKNILVTGGAGFIGSRLCRVLSAEGAAVTAYDSLLAQVHGPDPVMDPSLRLIRGDVRDREALSAAIHKVAPHIVVHLAAETGTGQSADEPSRYCDVNVSGTASLIELLKAMPRPPERIVLAATRAVYGEGAYETADGFLLAPEPRSTEAMAQREFDALGPDGLRLAPVATPETLPPRPGSVYGSTKLMQEYLLQQTPAPWDHVILRLQNVYGPGQSLRNPYTGVLSIFCEQAMCGKQLKIFEDGDIHRDFVFVDDVVRAFALACVSREASRRIVNIGSGEKVSIHDAAQLILVQLGLDPRVEVTGQFRAGDIRHALADIGLAGTVLSWKPQVPFPQGVARLVAWAREQSAGACQ